MKKLLLTAAIMAVAVPAQAVEFNPYLGFDLQRISYDYATDDLGGGIVIDGDDIADSSLNAFNVHIGSRLHDNFGLELGYFRSAGADKNSNFDISAFTGNAGDEISDTSVKVQGFSLDLLGYIPLGEKVDLIGTGGVTWSRADIDIDAIVLGNPVSLEEEDDEFGLRVGAGAQANITDRVGARGLVRYQTADFEGIADNAWIYTLGLNFSLQ